MTDRIVWWIGAVHLAVYGAVGFLLVLTWAVWRVHAHLGLMRVILLWHLARQRWDRRHVDGLSDADWERGEPDPNPPPRNRA